MTLANIGPMEISLIFLALLLLFGAKKLPELARGIGKSMGEFKKARSEFEDEIMNAETEAKESPYSSLAPLLLGAFLCLGFGSWALADPHSPPPTVKASEDLRFMSYNLWNFLTMDRYVDGKRTSRPKPEREVTPLLDIIVESDPDILGICEIGTAEDLRTFKALLARKGLTYEFTAHTGGGDSVRHLALLSKFPIAKHSSPPKEALVYPLEGSEETMGRGILHVEIETHGHYLHFLGTHLKSKRPVPPKDQELIRINEARLLREYADNILKNDKNAKVIAYGDFNDTPRSRTLRTVKGHGGSNRFLEPIYLVDSRGEHWTHFWKTDLSYAVLDYVCLSKSAKPFVAESSHLVDAPLWNSASDHRALVLDLKPQAVE